MVITLFTIKNFYSMILMQHKSYNFYGCFHRLMASLWNSLLISSSFFCVNVHRITVITLQKPKHIKINWKTFVQQYVLKTKKLVPLQFTEEKIISKFENYHILSCHYILTLLCYCSVATAFPYIRIQNAGAGDGFTRFAHIARMWQPRKLFCN